MPQFFSTSRVKASSFSTFCWMWIWASRRGPRRGGLERRGGEGWGPRGCRCRSRPGGGRSARIRQRRSGGRSRGCGRCGGAASRRPGWPRRARRFGVGVVLVGGWSRGRGCVAGSGPRGSRAASASRTRRPCRRAAARWPRRRRPRGGRRGYRRGIDWDGGVDLSGGSIHVNALVDRGLGRVDRVGGGRGDPLAADRGELAQHAGERGGERLQAEVGVPETEIKPVCHGGLF